MCHHIGAKIIMANYLKKYDKPLTYRILDKIRHNILSQFDEYVEVEISVSSMLSVVELYPEMFRWRDNRIIKAESSESYFRDDYIEEHFNWDIDQSIKDETIKAICSV